MEYKIVNEYEVKLNKGDLLIVRKNNYIIGFVHGNDEKNVIAKITEFNDKTYSVYAYVNGSMTVSFTNGDFEIKRKEEFENEI